MFTNQFFNKIYTSDASSLSSIDDLVKVFIEFYYSIASDKGLKDKEDEMMRLLKEFLMNNQKVLLNEFKAIDVNNTGLISFKELKIILNETKIDIEGELLEYLIYQMKKSKQCSLHQLDYSIINLLLKKEDGQNKCITDSNNEEDEDLKMTEEEYNTKTKEMLSKIVNNIISTKTTITNILLNDNNQKEKQHRPEYTQLRINEAIQLLQSKLAINLTKVEVIIFYNKYSISSEDNYDEGVETLNVNSLYDDLNSLLITSNKFLQGISSYLHNKELEFNNFFSLISKTDIIKCYSIEPEIENSYIDLINIQPLLAKCQIEIEEKDRIPILFTDNNINLDYFSFIFTCTPQMHFIPFDNIKAVNVLEKSITMEYEKDSSNQAEEDL